VIKGAVEEIVLYCIVLLAKYGANILNIYFHHNKVQRWCFVTILIKRVCILE